MDFLELFPPAEATPLRPLIAPGFTSAPVSRSHARGQNFGRVHALGVWAVRDLTVAGPHAFLFAEGRRVTATSFSPRYVEKLVAGGSVDPGVGLDLPQRVIEEPVIVVIGWGQDVYGHGLIEAMPRAKLASRALGPAACDARILIPASAKPWFRDLLAMAGARRFVEYDPARERVLLEQAFVPTLVVDGGLHPAARDLFAEMRPEPAGGGPEVVYVTRRNAVVTRRIDLRNADAVERVAERAGLRIVSPEGLSIPAQARLFASARLVVGEYGSALMNAVFCHPGAVVGAIGARSQLLSVICALGGVRQSFLDPSGDPEHPDGYAVDTDTFASWLDELLLAVDGRPEAAGRGGG